MDQSEKVQNARAKLAERMGDNVKLGGKGSQRRKVKVVHKTTINSDTKLKTVIKKFGAQVLPDIAEVNMFQDDNTVMQFKKPEVYGSIPNQTIIVFGAPETKDLKDVFSEIMNQMGTKQLEKLKELNLGGKKRAEPIKEENEDDEVPELVNFEEVSKQN